MIVVHEVVDEPYDPLAVEVDDVLPMDDARAHSRVHIPLHLLIRGGKQYVWSHRAAGTMYVQRSVRICVI